MAFVFSSATRVFFNALDISTYLNAASLDGSVDTADTTGFGVSAKTYIPGNRDRVFTAAGHYDPTAQAYLEAALVAGSGGVLTFCPGGGAAEDLSWMSSVITTTLTKSSNIADAVAFSWDAQPSGDASYGWVQHALGEDTNTTTGTSIDGTAATTTGWTAHVHCTAIDAGGGSWVIKLEDSANNSAWSDVSGGAFTALTAAGSQRLVSATGATLRRYTRYTATRTGGSAGEGITFHLSLSRFLIA